MLHLRAAAIMGFVVVLAACGGVETTSAPSAVPSQLVRPQVPEGWIALASGEVSLVVPPDLVRMEIPEGILVQGRMVGGITPIQVWATGPESIIPQPTGGEPLVGWLQDSGWLPREGDASSRELLLPAGRALEVTVSVRPGTSEASIVTVWAVVTTRGVGVLQILGDPTVISDRWDEVQLLPLLLSFGD